MSKRKGVKLSYTSWQWTYVNAWIVGVNVGLAAGTHAGPYHWAFVIALTTLAAYFTRKDLHRNGLLDRLYGWSTAELQRDPLALLKRTPARKRSLVFTHTQKEEQP